MVEQAQGASNLLLAVRLPLVELARHLGNSERPRLGIGNSLCEHKDQQRPLTAGSWEHVRRGEGFKAGDNTNNSCVLKRLSGSKL